MSGPLEDAGQSPAKPLPRAGVLRRYAGAPWGTRFFLGLRWFWTPYAQMAALLPARGTIIDGGSGHGLFSLALALQSPSRRVRGVDHSRERLGMAEGAARGLPNLSFREGDFRRIRGNRLAGIALIDVLHYLPYGAQRRLLKDSFRSLRRGGVLLFRDVDRGPGLSSFLNGLHESLMTGLGLTRAEGLYFRTAAEWSRLAEQAGFEVRQKPTGRFPFADVLFHCRKP